MEIISYLISGAVITIISNFLFKNCTSIPNFLRSFLKFTITLNLLSVAFVKYFLKQPILLIGGNYDINNNIKYIFFTMILGILYLIIRNIFIKKFIFENYSPRYEKKTKYFKILSIIIYIISSIFIFWGHWFIQSVGEITPEQLLFSIKSPILNASSNMVMDVINTPIFEILVSTLIFIIIISFPYDIYLKNYNSKRKIISNKLLKNISFTISIIFFITGSMYFFKEFSLKKILKSSLINSNYIENNYIDPRNVEMTFPSKKRNLIHIYWESGENSYMSKDLGGYMNENLMPELTTLAKDGISFSHNNSFGGPHQIYGSSWSVAGFINMSAGIPLKVNLNSNYFGKDGNFLPGTIALGDILEAQGYNQTLMLGSDADFGGLSSYFKSHGNYNIFDIKTAKNKNLLPEDYNVWWGFEDDKLYEFAKDELLRLHKEGKPFNFTMETADTHFPDGYLSKNADEKHESQYANVIAYSSKELANFIAWIQQQDFYDNTTIVITGDHLSMDKKFFQDFNPSYKRSIFNLIINTPLTTTKVKNRDFAPFDFFPTILASLDVDIKGNRLGLGTNLFSNEKTLIERDGIDIVQDNLEANSTFFANNLSGENNESIFKNTLITEK